jgi:hypothetical protein
MTSSLHTGIVRKTWHYDNCMNVRLLPPESFNHLGEFTENYNEYRATWVLKFSSTSKTKITDVLKTELCQHVPTFTTSVYSQVLPGDVQKQLRNYDKLRRLFFVYSHYIKHHEIKFIPTHHVVHRIVICYILIHRCHHVSSYVWKATEKIKWLTNWKFLYTGCAHSYCVPKEDDKCKQSAPLKERTSHVYSSYNKEITLFEVGERLVTWAVIREMMQFPRLLWKRTVTTGASCRTCQIRTLGLSVSPGILKSLLGGADSSSLMECYTTPTAWPWRWRY